MIVGHRAPSSFNMSSYRPIVLWTHLNHFKPNSMILIQKYMFLGLGPGPGPGPAAPGRVLLLDQVLVLALDQVLVLG